MSDERRRAARPVAVVVPYEDGPYVLRGDFTLQDQDGSVIDARRRTVALCRCGRSRIKPFCDGSHRTIRFRAPSAPPERTLPTAAEGPAETTRPSG